jgi:hypothetical protein
MQQVGGPRCRHTATAALVAWVALCLGLPAWPWPASTAHAAIDGWRGVPETVPTDEGGEGISGDGNAPPADTIVVSEPGALIPLPSGCTAPPPAVAVFVGTLVARATNEARFEVAQIKAGSLEGYASGAIVDVRYEESIFYTLEVGSSYLVGAAPDATGALASKVREPKPLFGGDGVIGANDSDVQCPVIEDPVRTLRSDGSEIDVGLLAPLAKSKAVLISAVTRPLAVGFGVLLLLTAVKLLAAATIRALRSGGVYEAEPKQRVRRTRRHAVAVGDAAAEDGSVTGGDSDAAQFGDGVSEAEGVAVEGAAGDQHVGAG